MASLASGKTLDVGFAKLPNPYLMGNIIGIDLIPVPCPPNYAGVVTGDVAHPSFREGFFDTVLAGELIEHLENHLKFLRDCRRLLRLGGRLIVSTPNPYFPPVIFLNWFMVRKFYYSPNHVFEIAPRFMLRFLEQNGFRLQKMLPVGAVVPIGSRHFVTIPLPWFLSYQIIYVAEAVV